MRPRTILRLAVAMRIYLRVLFAVGFLLLAVPAVLALAGEQNRGIGPVVLSGVVIQEHGDDFATNTSRYFLTLVTDKERYSLVGPGIAAVRAGLHVTVNGQLTGGTINLASSGSVQVDTATKLSAAEANALTGATTSTAAAQTKNVAVLLINFAAPTPRPTPSPTPCVTPPPTSTPSPTSTPAASATPDPTATPFTCPPPTPTPTPSPTPVPPPQPWTPAQVSGYYFDNTKSVASFYREVSNGSLTVTGKVFGWYTLTMSTSTCDYNGFATAARAAATAAGVDLTAYTNVTYAFPKVSACSWGGMGNVYGPYTWINGNAAMGVYVPSHELGHNFGSHHASSLTCTNSSGTRVQYSSNCTASEYGDPFDVMGSNASSSGGIHHQNTWAMRQIGVLTTADQQTVTTTGTYFVATAPVGGGTPRIVRILRPAGDYYYLEFRQPYGSLYENWDPSLPVVNGVMIRIAPDRTRIQSKLIDCHPETSTFSDAPCLVGERFVDKVNTITIITKSITAAGASVYVQVGPDVSAPSAPASLTATWSSGTSIGLAWRAATDEIGVTGYEIRRDGTLITTVGGTTLAYTDTAAPSSVKYYTVAARDAAGNVGQAASVYVGPPDTTPPGVPADVAASATVAGSATLTWAPATDDIAVTGYDVSVDGTVVATTAALSYTVRGVTSDQALSFAVAARDAAGNVGADASTDFVMPDLVAPGSPAGLATTSVGKTQVSLAWSAASDDVGVVGYTISRNGVDLGSVVGTTFDDTGAAPAMTYSYAVAAVDGAGNVGSSVSVSATTIEATPPIVVAPTTVVAGSGQLGTSTVPIVVSWSATDASSGIASMELQQSKNGGTWSTVSLPAPTSTSVTLSRPPGYTYAFRVRATDGVANTSSWVSGPTSKLSARQETNTSITYSGTWTAATNTTAYGGALKYATSSSASATLTFTGRSVAWIAARTSTRGMADIYVDGTYVTTVDLYSATSLPRSIVFTRSWSVSGAHKLQIRVRGTSGRPRVDVDAFIVLV